MNKVYLFLYFVWIKLKIEKSTYVYIFAHNASYVIYFKYISIYVYIYFGQLGNLWMGQLWDGYTKLHSTVPQEQINKRKEKRNK